MKNDSNINKAFDLVKDIEFEKVVNMVKEQPLEGFSDNKTDNLNIERIYQSKNDVIDEFNQMKEEITNNNYPESLIKKEIEKIAENLIYNHKESIESLKKGGYFFNFPLLGKLWAFSDILKDYYNVPKQETESLFLQWDSNVNILYHLFKELKEKEYIKDDKSKIAQFLKKTFQLNAKESTIYNQIKEGGTPPSGFDLHLPENPSKKGNDT
jgi:hypothetical protein